MSTIPSWKPDRQGFVCHWLVSGPLTGALEADDETIVIPFSAQTGQGKEEIWDLIEKILGGANE